MVDRTRVVARSTHTVLQRALDLFFAVRGLPDGEEKLVREDDVEPGVLGVLRGEPGVCGGDILVELRVHVVFDGEGGVLGGAGVVVHGEGAVLVWAVGVGAGRVTRCRVGGHLDFGGPSEEIWGGGGVCWYIVGGGSRYLGGGV